MKHYQIKISYISLGAVLISSILWLNWNFITPLADDPTLMTWAKNGAHVSPDWGPLYVGAARIMYRFFNDEDAFKAVFSIIYACNFFASFILLSVVTKRDQAAFVMAVLMSVSGLSVFGSAGAIGAPSSVSGNAALTFVMLGLSFVLADIGCRARSLSCASVLFLCAALCRPEFLWVALFCWSLSTYYLVRQVLGGRVSPSSLWLWLVMSTGGASLIFVWGWPAPSQSRAWLAFGQHAGLSFCMSFDKICDNMNVWSDWQKITDMLYPGSTTIREAVLGYPLTFLEHVARNGIIAVWAAWAMIFHFDVLSIPHVIGNCIGLFTVIATSIYLRKRFVLARKNPNRIFESIRISNVFILFFLLAPQLANWLLLFPRYHYMVVPIYVLVTGFAWLYARLQSLCLPQMRSSR